MLTNTIRMLFFFLLSSIAPAQTYFLEWFLQPGSGFPYTPPATPPVLPGEPRIATVAYESVAGTDTFKSYCGQSKVASPCSDVWCDYTEFVALVIWDISVDVPPFVTIPGFHALFNQFHLVSTTAYSPTSTFTIDQAQYGNLIGCPSTPHDDAPCYVSEWDSGLVLPSGFLISVQWFTLDYNAAYRMSVSQYHFIP